MIPRTETFDGVRSEGGVTNAPDTYTLDGTQYILVARGLNLYAFALH